jgi:ribonuclease HI
VGFLIEDLVKAGIPFNDALTLQEEGEVPINIWEMPWQHLKKAVFDLLGRTRDKRVDTHRTFAGNFDELDTDLIKQISNHLGPKEQRVYMHVATGGFWGEDHMQEVFETDGKCPHCGLPNVNTRHISWLCPVINAKRSFKDLEDFKSQCLPEAIANGLPVAMQGSSKQAFWGDCNQDGLCNSSKQLIGIPCNKYAQLKADSNDAIIDTQLKAKNAKVLCNNTARAAFNHLRTSDGDCVNPVPFRCYIKAPDLINVFTDGSWLNPKKWFLGFGGAGVHWPGRAISKEDLGDKLCYYKPLNEGEHMLAFHTQDKNGLNLSTKVEAYNGNSTRAEISAGLIALMAEGPIHIGSDSRAFVDRANASLIKIHKHKRFKKPWGVVSDGDLWAHFAKAVKAKGISSIKISWVKGHAKEVHIKEGITDAYKKQGNDEADDCADKGTGFFGSDLIKIAAAIDARHTCYKHFMVKVFLSTLWRPTSSTGSSLWPRMRRQKPANRGRTCQGPIPLWDTSPHVMGGCLKLFPVCNAMPSSRTCMQLNTLRHFSQAS